VGGFDDGCSGDCEKRVLLEKGRVVDQENQNESIRRFRGGPGLRTGKVTSTLRQAQDGQAQCEQGRLAGFFNCNRWLSLVFLVLFNRWLSLVLLVLS